MDISDLNIRKTNASFFQIEWINLLVFSQLLCTNLRYLLVILPMYFQSIISISRCHFLRSAYCFARYIDDLLDGDICIEEPPSEYVQKAISTIFSGKNTETNPVHLVTLGRYVFHHIDRFENEFVKPSENLQTLISAMLFDRHRMEKLLLLPQNKLDDHHLTTFISSLNVTLCISGANYEPEQIFPLAKAQGSLYTLRDLKKDLERSINNIPEHVLLSTHFDTSYYYDYSFLINSEPVYEWINAELIRGMENLSQFNSILMNHEDSRFRLTLKPLVFGLNHLSSRLEKIFSKPV